MKLAPLVLCLGLLPSVCLAATGRPTPEPPREGVPDVQEVNGYTIRIIRMERDSYGYEIRRGPEVFVHQRRNPFTGSQKGLQLKEDALKTATWLLQNVVMREQMLPRNRRLPEGSASIRLLPTTVADELGVTVVPTR